MVRTPAGVELAERELLAPRESIRLPERPDRGWADGWPHRSHLGLLGIRTALIAGHHKAGVRSRHGRGNHTLQDTGLGGVLIRRIRGGADK